MTTDTTEVLWLAARTDYTVLEVIEMSGLSRSIIDELVECGALPARRAPGAVEETGVVFEAESIELARAAGRLREHFELDHAGLAVAVSLLRRVRLLEIRLANIGAR